MKSWFSTWFDSAYYPILYQHRNDKEAQLFINNLMEFLPVKNKMDLLDLACGNGRHAIHLAKMGHTVTGLDLSPNAIQEANRTAFTNNLDVHFDVHDMRKSLAPRQFDIIFNLFTSFGYFSDENDERSTLQSIHEALKSNRSYFVMDFLNARRVIDNLKLSEVKQLSGIDFHIRRHIENKKVIKNIRFTDKGQVFNFQESVNLLFKEDFSALFDQVGFQMINTFGDYQLNPFDKNQSDRLIMICQKHD